MLVTNTEILNKLGPKVKKARIVKGYTQEYVAEHINVSADLLRNIENSRNIGSISTLINLCNLLDITLNDLFIDFLHNSNSNIDANLYNYLNQISAEDKGLLKKIIIHIDKNY